MTQLAEAGSVEFALLGPRNGVRTYGVAAAVPAVPLQRAGTGDGADRVANSSATGRSTSSQSEVALSVLRAVEACTGLPGVVVGAVPFDTSQPTRLYVPEQVVWEMRSNPAPSANGSHQPAALTSDELPDDPRYRAAVATAIARIDAGELDKIVLARALDVTLDWPVDVDALLGRLAAGNPDGYAYRVDLDDHATSSLVGASPELLVEVDYDIVRSNPLAGSAPRARDAAIDARRRALLADSAKDRREHAHVVAAVEAALAPLTSDLDVPAGPSVSSTRDLWHLSTSVTGRIRPGLTSLDLAYALHPTPAVCGVPQKRSAETIAELEPVDRGFYSGLVGWMDSSGQGEWVIALRGGLVEGSRVRVHAGAGIVADSDPSLEHAETATKMRTFLRALTQVGTPLRLEAANEPRAEEADEPARTRAGRQVVSL